MECKLRTTGRNLGVNVRTTSISADFKNLIFKFLLCGAFLILISRKSLRDQRMIHRFIEAILCLALLLSVMSVVLTLWVAEKQNRLSFCVYKLKTRQCVCRVDNNTLSELGWFFYDGVTDCKALDTLFSYLIAVVVLYASGGFLCFLSLVSLCYLWRQTSSSQPVDVDSYYPTTDWDSWINANYDYFRVITRGFAWFPPSYEESNWHRMRRVHRTPPPDYRSQNGSQTVSAPGSVSVSGSGSDHWQELPFHGGQTASASARYVTVVNVST